MCFSRAKDLDCWVCFLPWLLIMRWWIGWLRLSVDIGAWIPWRRHGYKVRKHPAPGRHEAKHCCSSADGVPASGSCSLGFAQSELGGLIRFEDQDSSKPNERIRDYWNFFLMIVSSHSVRWKSLQLCWMNSFEASLDALQALQLQKSEKILALLIPNLINPKPQVQNQEWNIFTVLSSLGVWDQHPTASDCCVHLPNWNRLQLRKNDCFATTKLLWKDGNGSMCRQY